MYLWICNQWRVITYPPDQLIRGGISHFVTPAATQGAQSGSTSNLTLLTPSEWGLVNLTGIPRGCIPYEVPTRFARTNAPGVPTTLRPTPTDLYAYLVKPNCIIYWKDKSLITISDCRILATSTFDIIKVTRIKWCAFTDIATPPTRLNRI